MLHEIDTALRELLRTAVPEDVTIRFDPPDKSWRGSGVTALDVFLYGVREDMTGRQTGWTEQRDPRGRVVSRHAPPRRYYVNYLLTAWGDATEDEHRLLGAAMALLAQHEYLPPKFLTGSLGAAEIPVPIAVAHPDFGAASPDLWSALGVPPKASLDLVVCATLVPDLVTNLAPAPRRVELGVANETAQPATDKSIDDVPDPEKVIRERN